MDAPENDLAVSLLDGPFDVTTEFDGIEISESASIVLQLVNPLGSSQEFSIDGAPRQIIVLDEGGIPCRSGFVGARCSTCLTLSWTPRKAGFLEDSVVISAPAAPSSITIHCLGTAMPGRASPAITTPSPPAGAQLLPRSCNSDEAAPSTTSKGASWSDQSTSDGGSSGSNPRLKRVQHRMRKSLAHISEQFEEHCTSRSTSITSRSGHRSKSRDHSRCRRSLTPESAMPSLRQTRITQTQGSGYQSAPFARPRRSSTTATCPPPAPSYYSRRPAGTAAFALPSASSTSSRLEPHNRRASIGEGDISFSKSMSHGGKQRSSCTTPRSFQQAPVTPRSRAPERAGRSSLDLPANLYTSKSKPVEADRASRSCSRRSSLTRFKDPVQTLRQALSPIPSTSNVDYGDLPQLQPQQDRLSEQNLHRLSISLSPTRSQSNGEPESPTDATRPTIGSSQSRAGLPTLPGTAPVRESWTSGLRNTRQKQPSLEQHEMPRAKEASDAFAIYHTETWQRKQDRAFTGWLNMVLGQSYKDRCNLERSQEVVSKSAELRCRHQLGQLREQDEEIVHALNVIEQRIKADRLSFRENSLLDDGSLRKKAVQALMSYNPFWLHLAIDTVLNRRTFQDDAALESGAVSAADLEAVIREEFLSDTTLLGGSSLMRRSDRKELLAQLVIYRVLTLVIILDRVPGQMQLPQQAPFLFRLGAPLKSSVEVLTACLHGSLSGIGNLPRQLAKMHYTVSFKQRDIDEWPMLVSSLGPDLSNGIILCKLISLLLGEDVMAEVRKPTAAQRVIKVRNVRMALDAGKRAGIDLSHLSANRGEASEVVSLRVDDIVSGHCREVLALLWAVAQTSFAHSVPLAQLQTEVRMLERKLLVKGLPAEASGVRMQPGNDGPVTRLLFRWVRMVCGLYGVTLRNCSSSFTDGSAVCLLIHHYVPSLIGWSSIAIPPPVPLDIAEQVLGVDVLGGLEGLSWPDYIGMQNSVIQDEIEAYRSGIIHNFELISKALRYLGDVPEMLSADDITSRYCDERSVLLYLASLCPRLLEFAHEGKAAHIIAGWWRWTRVRLITLNPGELASRVRDRIRKDAALHRWALFTQGVSKLAFNIRAAKSLEAITVHRSALARFARLGHAASTVVMLQRRVRAKQAILAARCKRTMHVEEQRLFAVIVLQAHVRRVRAQRRLRALQHAASVIAAAWHRYVRNRVASFEASAATVVQRHWRGYHVRQMVAHQACAATVIQAMMRRVLARRRFKRFQAAAIIIQSSWRAAVCAEDFHKKRTAAIIIQSQARRIAAMRHLRRLRWACIVLQSKIRAFLARTRFQRLRAASICVQAAWRQHACYIGYLHTRRCAVIIQSAVRMWLALRRQQRFVRAATVLQTAWRYWRLRQMLAVRRSAAVCLQAKWRARAQRAAYIKQRQAAVVVQAMWRAVCAQRAFAARRAAAVTIQSMYRGAAKRSAFLRMQSAATTIQAHNRGHSVRCRARMQLNAVVTMQSAYRAFAARRKFSTTQRSVVVVQRAWRMFSARQASATMIQAAFRSFICRQRFLHARACAIKLQAAVRSLQGSKQYRHLRACTIKLQAALRMSQASRRYKAQRAAAITVQAAVRGVHARRTAMQRRSAICTIQWAWVAYRCRWKFRTANAQVVVCQALVRRFLVQRRLSRAGEAATCIQAHWRRHVAKTTVGQQIKLVKHLQACVRRVLAMCQYRKKKRAVITIQSYIRMWSVRVAIAEATTAATLIQAKWRGMQQSMRYAKMRSAALCVQAGWRGVVVRATLLKKDTAASIIQGAWRMYVQERDAAVAIQSSWRCYRQRKHEAWAATCIQSWWRRYAVLYHLQGLTVQTLLLQAAWRGTVVRRRLAKWHKAAYVLQRSFRAFNEQRVLVRQRIAVWRIEFAVEAWIERKSFVEYLLQEKEAKIAAERQGAATLIAAAYRGHLARAWVQPMLCTARKHAARHEAACILQQAWRVYLIREEIRARCQALAVITDALPQVRALVERRQHQRHVAALALAITPVQAAVRGWLVRRQVAQQHASSKVIQAWVRGWIARKAAGHQVREMAARLHRIELKPSGDSKCLGTRVKAALSQLLSCHSVEQARSACEAAAWGTTYSRNACVWLVEDGALQALAKFMRVCSTNKSNASLLCSMLTTLANILSHNEKVVPVAPALLAGMVPTISDLLQLFRDVQDVFCLAVLVLQRICARDKVFQSMNAPDKTLVHWKGVYKVLYNRLQKEGQYLSKLENKKGSDASACSATRRLISTSEQLKALKELIEPVQTTIEAKIGSGELHRHGRLHHADVLARIPQPSPGDWLHDITCGGSIWVPKNTKVRSTFREVLHNVHGFVLPDVLKDVSGKDVVRDGEEGPIVSTACIAGPRAKASKVHSTTVHAPDAHQYHALQPTGQVHVTDELTHKVSKLPKRAAVRGDNTENIVPGQEGS